MTTPVVATAMGFTQAWMVVVTARADMGPGQSGLLMLGTAPHIWVDVEVPRSCSKSLCSSAR